MTTWSDVKGRTYEQVRILELRKRLAGLTVAAKRHCDDMCHVIDHDLAASIHEADGFLRVLEKGDKQ
jgi:hypothetical protein